MILLVGTVLLFPFQFERLSTTDEYSIAKTAFTNHYDLSVILQRSIRLQIHFMSLISTNLVPDF